MQGPYSIYEDEGPARHNFIWERDRDWDDDAYYEPVSPLPPTSTNSFPIRRETRYVRSSSPHSSIASTYHVPNQEDLEYSHVSHPKHELRDELHERSHPRLASRSRSTSRSLSRSQNQSRSRNYSLSRSRSVAMSDYRPRSHSRTSIYLEPTVVPLEDHPEDLEVYDVPRALPWYMHDGKTADYLDETDSHTDSDLNFTSQSAAPTPYPDHEETKFSNNRQ
jgi:hypothetical protein